MLGMNVMLLALLGMQYVKNQRIQEQIAGKVLRFHVLANSDTAEDQNLKLAVRDAVGSRMAELLSDVPDREACEQVVEAHLPEIAETAQAVVREAGYEYEVHAAIEETEFPSKTYGKFTFPAGKYEALRENTKRWRSPSGAEKVITGGASCTRICALREVCMKSWMRAPGRN